MAVEMIRSTLLNWYDGHARDLPWRTPPGSRHAPDPYRVWLSEIMLQQTTVAAVKGYFERFVARWPTVDALAAAADADLMSAWAGLGYYARARNLLACARVIAADHGGQFPSDPSALRALPGIGDYTSAAIAAIAFDRPATVVDGNVERVTARLFGVDTPMPGAKPELRRLAATLTPDQRPGDFAQAMMDLGATICTPRSPDCPRCPIAAWCVAAASGDPARLPVRAPRKAKPRRSGTAWWIEAEGHVLLVQRPARGLLGGMIALPSAGWDGQPDSTSPIDAMWRETPGAVDHVFTHFALSLRVAVTELATVPANIDLARINGTPIWWPIADLGGAGLPSLFEKAAGAALAFRPASSRHKLLR